MTRHTLTEKKQDTDSHRFTFFYLCPSVFICVLLIGGFQ
jgi:hypothetical protein